MSAFSASAWACGPWLAGVDGGGARLGDVGERLLLVGHVVLDGLDQVGDEVVAALELHVDLAPGVVHLVAALHQAVVHARQNGHDHDHDDDEDDDGDQPTLLSLRAPVATSVRHRRESTTCSFVPVRAARLSLVAMNARIRDIVVLVVGLAVVLAVAPRRLRRGARPGAGVGRRARSLAPVAHADAGRRPAPPSRSTSAGRSASPSARSRCYRRADAQRPVAPGCPMQHVGRLPDGRPGRQRQGGRRRHAGTRSGSPVRPNESRGWVREGQLAFYTTTSKIVIDLSRAQAQRVPPRAALVRTFPVAVGRPGLATPTGTSSSRRSCGRRTRTASTASCSSAPAPSSPS